LCLVVAFLWGFWVGSAGLVFRVLWFGLSLGWALLWVGWFVWWACGGRLVVGAGAGWVVGAGFGRGVVRVVGAGVGGRGWGVGGGCLWSAPPAPRGAAPTSYSRGPPPHTFFVTPLPPGVPWGSGARVLVWGGCTLACCGVAFPSAPSPRGRGRTTTRRPPSPWTCPHKVPTTWGRGALPPCSTTPDRAGHRPPPLWVVCFGLWFGVGGRPGAPAWRLLALGGFCGCWLLVCRWGPPQPPPPHPQTACSPHGPPGPGGGFLFCWADPPPGVRASPALCAWAPVLHLSRSFDSPTTSSVQVQTPEVHHNGPTRAPTLATTTSRPAADTPVVVLGVGPGAGPSTPAGSALPLRAFSPCGAGARPLPAALPPALGRWTPSPCRLGAAPGPRGCTRPSRPLPSRGDTPPLGVGPPRCCPNNLAHRLRWRTQGFIETSAHIQQTTLFSAQTHTQETPQNNGNNHPRTQQQQTDLEQQHEKHDRVAERNGPSATPYLMLWPESFFSEFRVMRFGRNTELPSKFAGPHPAATRSSSANAPLDE